MAEVSDGDRMLTVHRDGDEMTFHPTDMPCARCRPPFVVTDEMVKRAWIVFSKESWPGLTTMRIALEAALNG